VTLDSDPNTAAACSNAPSGHFTVFHLANLVQSAMVAPRKALLLAGLVSSSLALPARDNSAQSVLSVSTAAPSPTGNPSAQEPQASAPPRQPTCTSEIFCPGPILQAVQLAGLYSGTAAHLSSILDMTLSLYHRRRQILKHLSTSPRGTQQTKSLVHLTN
jgi:hypothetical protein